LSKSPYPYINRELSWLFFNQRVLEMSNNRDIPLLERLKFISIFSNNLDEFFMVRVAGVIDQIELGYEQKDPSRDTPKEIFNKIREIVEDLTILQNRYFLQLAKELKDVDIEINKLKDANSEYLDLVFNKVILPSISPITISSGNPFPFIANKRSGILVCMRKDNIDFYSLIIIPDNLKKLFVTNYQNKTFVYTTDFIISHKLNEIYNSYDINDFYIFRITRDADLSIEEEGAEDLLELIETWLYKRRKGNVVRVQINKIPTDNIKNFLINNFDIPPEFIYVTSGVIDYTAFFNFKSANEELYFKPFESYIPNKIPTDVKIFDYLKKNEIIFYRPYNDFSFISNLIDIAASDPDTISIKMTIYRVNNDSKIIDSLVKAAINGKSVFVVVELKARFDEQVNVNFAKRLEDAGCIVSYGIPTLKIHSKNLLIIRNENDEIRRYAHCSTGNYHENTSKIYTDIDYITSNEKFTFEVNGLFNFLMGYTDYVKWEKLFLAPNYLRDKLLQLIDNEIKNAKKGDEAYIIIKVNSLIDKALIKKLYEASKEGVKIDLIVRGICGIMPKIKGLSDSVRVVSIIGRFLEHTRIFYFHNNGDIRLFIASADFMERNMDRRVEYLTEIENKTLKMKLLNILKKQLSDNVNSWELIKDKYYKVTKGKSKIDSQSHFINHRF